MLRYGLGGFHQLSGCQTDQLTGNQVLLLRLGDYRRLSQTPSLTRGFFVGGTLAAGNAWVRRSAVSLAGLRTGISLPLGADTGSGQLYLGITHAPRGIQFEPGRYGLVLGITHAPRGRTGLALFIGRP